jgi:hypothetical protein
VNSILESGGSVEPSHETEKEKLMRTSLMLGAVVGGCLLAVPGVAQEKIPWAKSFSAAMARAKTSHKLVMADFYTDW